MRLSSATALLTATAFLGAVSFVVRFMLVAWWRTREGQAIMAFMGSLALVLGLAVAVRIFGHDYPGREWVRLGVFALLNVIFWVSFALLVRAQRRSG